MVKVKTNVNIISISFAILLVSSVLVPTGVVHAATTFVDSFDVSGQETTPLGLAFNTDGTKMFVIGTGSDNVNEYSCTTGFDVSTCTYSGDGERKAVGTEETNPSDLKFNTDGTKMFVIGFQEDNVNEYSCTTGFDVSTCTYSGDGQRKAVGTEEAAPTGLTFNTDGTKMFVIGNVGDDVNEYSCTTGFDVSTCTYSGDGERKAVGTEEDNPRALEFNTDGTKMFVMGASGDDVNVYACTTGFDVSTCTYSGDGQRFSVFAQEGTPVGLAFNTDGTKMFVSGNVGVDVDEYTLDVGFDFISTAPQTPTENLGMTDVVTTSITIVVELTENLGMTDTVIASQNVLLTENLGMTDSLFASGTTGTIMPSTTLPTGVSGTISSEIVTVSNPTTSGNSISFLGSTYDYTFSSSTLCDDGCTIQFTFTQADLDAAGISLSEATIFEDTEEDGTFVALATTITDGEPSPFTAQATTTSSGTIFGVGGSSSSSSTSSSGGGYTDGKPPSFSMAFSENEYPVTINGNNFSYLQLKNPIPTTLIETGRSAQVKVLLYENRGSERVEYFALYTNLDNNIMRGDNSDTFIAWQKGEEVQVNDPNKIFSSVKVSTATEGNKFAITFDIIFEEAIGESDIKLRTWDVKRNGMTFDIIDAWKIIQGDPVIEPEPILSLDPEPGIEPEMDPEPGVSLVIQQWGGYSPVSASDARLLSMIGIHGDHIPSWIKEMVRWINHDMITEQEFLNVIYYLYEHDAIY